MRTLRYLLLVLRMVVAGALGQKLRSVVIGLVLLLDTMLVLCGLALMDSIDDAMQRNLTSTIAGDLQIYSAAAPEKLQLFGELADAGTIPDFASIKSLLMEVPNVAAVVPMGMGNGYAQLGTALDRALADLRDALRHDRTDAVQESARRARYVVGALQPESLAEASLFASAEEKAQALADLERAHAETFWAELATTPWEHLEFLENQISPLAGDPNTVFFRLVGTDPGSFAQSFSRFEIVKGVPIPPGERGMLVNDALYERRFKNPVAYQLDRLFRQVVIERQSISDEVLGERVRQLVEKRSALVRDLDPAAVSDLERQLRARLGRSAEDSDSVENLLAELLTLTRDNLATRYQLFYDVVAPRMELYRVPVGGLLLVHGESRRGYPTAADLRLFGTYRFSGLQTREHGTVQSLGDTLAFYVIVDLLSLRELLALGAVDNDSELSALRAEAGLREVNREEAEDVLFGSAAVFRAPAGQTEPFAMPRLARVLGRADDDYTVTELEAGPVGSAAVILTNPDAVERTLADLRALAASNRLQVVTAREASGIVAQYLELVRVMLYVGLAVVFLIVLLVLNTAIVVATLGRTREMGTLRAIGAQRETVFLFVVVEVALLALVSATVGAAVGAAFLEWAASQGIPATSEIWEWLFGGPRLYPHFSAWNIGVAFLATFLVGCLATFYPIWLAVRVAPVVAIRGAA